MANLWTVAGQKSGQDDETVTTDPSTRLDDLIGQLLAAYDRHLRPKEASGLLGISEKTVRRYFKVIELGRSGMDPVQIQASVMDLSVNRIRMVLNAIRLRSYEPPEFVESSRELDADYLRHHRFEILHVLERLIDSLRRGLDLSVRPVIDHEWPVPFTGEIETDPAFEFEVEPLGRSVKDHFRNLGLLKHLKAIRTAARSYRDAGLNLAAEVITGEEHSDDFNFIVTSCVQSGLDLVRKPGTEVVRYSVVKDGSASWVKGGAYSLKCENRSIADGVAAYLNDIPQLTADSSLSRTLVRNGEELEKRLQDLSDLLKDSDLVMRTLNHSYCERCTDHASPAVNLASQGQ